MAKIIQFPTRQSKSLAGFDSYVKGLTDEEKKDGLITFSMYSAVLLSHCDEETHDAICADIASFGWEELLGLADVAVRAHAED